MSSSLYREQQPLIYMSIIERTRDAIIAFQEQVYDLHLDTIVPHMPHQWQRFIWYDRQLRAPDDQRDWLLRAQYWVDREIQARNLVDVTEKWAWTAQSLIADADDSKLGCRAKRRIVIVPQRGLWRLEDSLLRTSLAAWTAALTARLSLSDPLSVILPYERHALYRQLVRSVRVYQKNPGFPGRKMRGWKQRST